MELNKKENETILDLIQKADYIDCIKAVYLREIIKGYEVGISYEKDKSNFEDTADAAKRVKFLADEFKSKFNGTRINAVVRDMNDYYIHIPADQIIVFHRDKSTTHFNINYIGSSLDSITTNENKDVTRV